jgi:hypothetical protein
VFAAAIVILGAYLIGSVSFAIVVSRAYGLPDPHEYGSGNPGATNVLRTGNRKAALLTLAGDGIKGWLAVFLAQAAATSLDLAPWVVPAAVLARVDRGNAAGILTRPCLPPPSFAAHRPAPRTPRSSSPACDRCAPMALPTNGSRQPGSLPRRLPMHRSNISWMRCG